MRYLFSMEPAALSHYMQARSGFKAESNMMPTRQERQSYTVIDGKAQLKITGVLSNERDLFDMIFGIGPSMTYPEIIDAIDSAQSDSTVNSIELLIDSPGGYVDGVELAALAIATSPKEINAIVTGQATSAAYWLASQAKTIEAKTRTASFGSIGVAVAMWNDDKIVDITSTNAPNKRPNVGTDEGKSIIREELDQIHEIFAADVARGRKVSIEKVNSDFGKGGTMLSSGAKAAGMIDIEPGNLFDQVLKPAVGGQAGEAKNKGGVSIMTLEELKGQHPEAFTAAKAEGIAEGIKAEKERVSGLAAWRGISAEADKVVEEAIASGKVYHDVASQLAAAVAKGQTLAGENAPIVETGIEDKTALDADEKLLCQKMGLSEDTYLAQKKKGAK